MSKQVAGNDEELAFYRMQSEITRPGKYESRFGDLPTDISDLCLVIQNLLLHQFWIQDEKNYGITVESLKARGRNLNHEINIRTVEEKLDFLMKLEDRPLSGTRKADRRVLGNCRDYSVLLVSMLRYQGIPARVRSGVARYFHPQEEKILDDHFICEFWDESGERWQRADAQIDNVQQRVLQLHVDSTDLPPGHFLDGGESYYELMSGRVKPENVGIFEFRGWPYVHYKLISDLANVNRMEVLAWEGWGICDRIDKKTLSQEDHILLEKTAKILSTLSTDRGMFKKARHLFEKHPYLKVPKGYYPHYHELPFLN